MTNPQEFLAEIAVLTEEINSLTEKKQLLLDALKASVGPNDKVSYAGYRAQWKPGRKSTDHEAAAKAAEVAPDVISAHTVVKESVAWAKVTKAAKVPKAILDRFTTEGEPSFVVEPIE